MYWRFNHSHRWGRYQQYDTLGSSEQNQGLHRQHDPHSIQVRLWNCQFMLDRLEAIRGQRLSPPSQKPCCFLQLCTIHDEIIPEGFWLWDCSFHDFSRDVSSSRPLLSYHISTWSNTTNENLEEVKWAKTPLKVEWNEISSWGPLSFSVGCCRTLNSGCCVVRSQQQGRTWAC